MIKRSMSIAGHRTSIALEAEFWAGIEAIAAAHALPLPLMIKRIDEQRTAANLSSAIRVAVLDWYRSRETA